jgi:hypothetical protein
VGLPVFARAQQSPLPLDGVLNSAAAGPFARMIEAFRQSLGNAGYVDGRNVRIIDVRWADGQYERLPQIWSRDGSTCSRLRAGTLQRLPPSQRPRRSQSSS